MDLHFLSDKLTRSGKFNTVFLGDSITSAEWVHPNWREIIEYVLKEELMKLIPDWKLPSWKMRFYNSGFDGSTSEDWLKLFDAAVVNNKPDLVIVMGTMNDMDLKISVSDSVRNIKKIINSLREKNINVVYSTDLASLNDSYNAEYKKYIDGVKSIFPIENVTFINLFEEFGKLPRKKFFTFVSQGNTVLGIKPGDIDFNHPNPLGNAYIAKIILEQIFSINFDPEQYIQDSLKGEMFPSY